VKLKPCHQEAVVLHLLYLRAFEVSQAATGRWIEQRGAHGWIHGVASEYKTCRHAASADLVGRQAFTEVA
jgi:hypothetical protein